MHLSVFTGEAFFFQSVEVNTETHNWSSYRGWETTESSVLNWTSMHTPPPKVQGSLQKRGQEDYTTQRGWMTTTKLLSRYNIWTHSSCEHAQDLCKFKPDKIPASRKGQGHKVSLLDEELLAFTVAGRGKFSSMEWYSRTGQRASRQHKLASIVVADSLKTNQPPTNAHILYDNIYCQRIDKLFKERKWDVLKKLIQPQTGPMSL